MMHYFLIVAFELWWLPPHQNLHVKVEQNTEASYVVDVILKHSNHQSQGVQEDTL